MIPTRPLALFAALSAVTACAARPTAVAPGNSAPAARGGCPDLATQRAIVAGELEVKASAELEIDTCLVFRGGGEPRWYLRAHIDGERTVTQAELVARPDASVVWSAVERFGGDGDGPRSEAYDLSTTGWRAIDLDGDGDDELFAQERLARAGETSAGVRVARLVDDAVLESFTMDLGASSDEAGPRCDATVAIDAPTRAGAIVVVTLAGDGCEAPLRRQYRWDGAALVRR